MFFPSQIYSFAAAESGELTDADYSGDYGNLDDDYKSTIPDEVTDIPSTVSETITQTIDLVKSTIKSTTQLATEASTAPISILVDTTTPGDYIYLGRKNIFLDFCGFLWIFVDFLGSFLVVF